MLTALKKFWWVLLLKGLLSLLFAVFAFRYQEVTMNALFVWFSVFLIVDGLLDLVRVMANWNSTEDRWLFVMQGGISILLGVLIFRNPESYAVFLAWVLALWSIVTGVSRVAMGIKLREEIKGEGWLIAAGVLSVIFGFIILRNPSVGVSFMMMLLGLLALVSGIFFIFLSLKLRKLSLAIEKRVSE